MTAMIKVCHPLPQWASAPAASGWKASDEFVSLNLYQNTKDVSHKGATIPYSNNVNHILDYSAVEVYEAPVNVH